MFVSVTRSACKPFLLVRVAAAFLLPGALACAAVAQEAAYGTLVLQSPVQAVATINGEGAFLVVPGQDLRWSRIHPGSYRIGVSSGGQQWQREVEVQPGRTETLVAALSSAGSPLAAGVPPPVVSPAHPPAYVPPARTPDPVPAAATLSTPSEKVTQQRKEDIEDREAQRRREQELLRQQREDRAAQQREREAEARALREQQRQEEEADSQKKRRRPKVH